MLRVGLVGCGRIAGFFHAPIMDAMSDVRVTALIDRDGGARTAMAARLPGATLYADWKRPLELGAIDAAVICLPPTLHAPAAIDCLRAGVPVYVEKPLALDLEEADAMIAARGEQVAMVGLNFRRHPKFEAARRLVQSGALGKLQGVRTLFTSARRQLPGWKGRPDAGGGAIDDLATHHLDLVPWLAGEAMEPDSIRASQRREEAGSFAAIMGELAGGASVQITAGQTTGTSAHVVELLGEAGHLRLDLTEPGGAEIERPPGRLASLGRLRRAAAGLAPARLRGAPPDPSFARALGDFVAAARGDGHAPEPGLEAGRRALDLARRASADAEGNGHSWAAAAE